MYYPSYLVNNRAPTIEAIIQLKSSSLYKLVLEMYLLIYEGLNTTQLCVKTCE